MDWKRPRSGGEYYARCSWMKIGSQEWYEDPPKILLFGIVQPFGTKSAAYLHY